MSVCLLWTLLRGRVPSATLWRACFAAWLDPPFGKRASPIVDNSIMRQIEEVSAWVTAHGGAAPRRKSSTADEQRLARVLMRLKARRTGTYYGRLLTAAEVAHFNDKLGAADVAHSQLSQGDGESQDIGEQMPHGVDDCAPNIQADTHTSQTGRRLRLRGLDIQWPFSQLLLSGLKVVEARRYALG